MPFAANFSCRDLQRSESALAEARLARDSLQRELTASQAAASALREVLAVRPLSNSSACISRFQLLES